MAYKLVTDNEQKTIPMCDLPGGKLAVVVEEGEYFGAIVQKESEPAEDFIALGAAHGNYSEGFDCDCDLLVRVLEEGELIEVKYS